MKYVVLDRDGTLIRHIPYLCDPSQVELLPTVVAGLNKFIASGCKLFLHTNQSGIARGYFSYADAVACNDSMLKKIDLGDRLFMDICVCPEAPNQDIFYRKPSPKYGLEIIEKFNIKKESLFYIGDNITDLLTARNVGCIGVGVNTGAFALREVLRQHGDEDFFPVFDTFLEAASYILNDD